MSIRVMSAVWDLDLPDSEKLIALALADWCSDEGICWPSVAQIAKKSSKSERTVQGALISLEKRGYLTRDQKPGKGCLYTLTPAGAAPRSDNTPADAAPPQPLRKTPAAAAPNTSGTTNTPKRASPSLGARTPKRASSIPESFAPVMTGKTADCVNGWPPGRLDDELEHFADYHRANGTTSHDWQASWRTWVKNSKKWEPKNGKRHHHDRPSGPIESRRRFREQHDVEPDLGYGAG